MAKRVRFYITRLKRASFPEFFYRCGQAFQRMYIAWLVRQGRLPCTIPQISPLTVKSLEMSNLCGYVDHRQVESILGGKFYTLNTGKNEIATIERQWRDVCSCAIDHSHSTVDIRAIWEPARLQHVTVLFAYLRQQSNTLKNLSVKEYARGEIIRWLTEMPFLHGPHYLSAMECGLRIPVFFSAITCLPLDERETATILSTIYHHAWWIENRLSLYSSLGNHTVCEAFGLVFAGGIYRGATDGQRWLERGISLLKQELSHQILSDGGPVEQSLNYHRFLLDVYWLVVDFLEKNNLADCSDFKPRLVRGEEFLAAFIDESGGMPAIGDSDEGYAVAPGIAPLRGAVTTEKKRYQRFPDAGYSVIRLANGTVVTFDHGPLGMAPLYNHGHSDALSITLTKNGVQLLVDTGTYRYNGVAEWRKYFKGTRAHNTVTIDGLDQAVQETGFIWSKPFTTELVRNEVTERQILLEAVNDGYARLKQPVKHRRTILVADDACLLINDTFSGKGSHDYELNFHLHPDVAAEERDGWWHLQKGQSRMSMTHFGDEKFSSLSGQEAPIIGWYSPSYGIKQESTVLQLRKNGHPEDVSFVTAICLDGLIPHEELERLAKSL